MKLSEIFRKPSEHEFGEGIGTCPNVRRCKKCGKYQRVPHQMDNLMLDGNGTAQLSDLPIKIFTNMAGFECEAAPVYTQYQYDHALEIEHRRSWAEGQDKGIHLQPEFSRLFFEKIRLNPTTLTYEIPRENYIALKDYMSDWHDNPNPLKG